MFDRQRRCHGKRFDGRRLPPGQKVVKRQFSVESILPVNYIGLGRSGRNQRLNRRLAARFGLNSCKFL